METNVDERKKTKTQLIGELAVLRQQIEQMVCSGFLESLLYVQKDRNRRSGVSTSLHRIQYMVYKRCNELPGSGKRLSLQLGTVS